MRLRTTRTLLPALALALSACGGTTAIGPSAAPAAVSQPAQATTIEVSEVWSRPALGPNDPQPTKPAMQPTKPAMQPSGGMGSEDRGPTGAVFLTVHNSGSAPDRLIGANSSVADVTEIHNVIDNQGVMEMRPVDGVDIPAGGTVQLKPGSFHVMLIGLHQGLALGDQFEVTLEFRRAGTITVKSTVRMPQ